MFERRLAVLRASGDMFEHMRMSSLCVRARAVCDDERSVRKRSLDIKLRETEEHDELPRDSQSVDQVLVHTLRCHAFVGITAPQPCLPVLWVNLQGRRAVSDDVLEVREVLVAGRAVAVED